MRLLIIPLCLQSTIQARNQQPCVWICGQLQEFFKSYEKLLDFLVCHLLYLACTRVKSFFGPEPITHYRRTTLKKNLTFVLVLALLVGTCFASPATVPGAGTPAMERPIYGIIPVIPPPPPPPIKVMSPDGIIPVIPPPPPPPIKVTSPDGIIPVIPPPPPPPIKVTSPDGIIPVIPPPPPPPIK
jgi:hypothetical protein